jgi:hypothetical protein
MAGPLRIGTCVARWRAADIHARLHVTLVPCARESESSGAARARRMTASSAASPMQPNDPRTAPFSTAAAIAPEDVEHPVGRRRKAHGGAIGGAGAGGEGVEPLEVVQKQDDA